MAAKKITARIPLPRTLRGRLIAGLVALLAVGCATVGLVTYFAVQRALHGELNTQLQTATGLARNCWEPVSQDNGQGDNGQPTGPATSPSGGSSSSIEQRCTGLNEGTLLAHIVNGQWLGAWLVGGGSFPL